MLTSQYLTILLWLHFLIVILSGADGGDIIEGINLNPRLDHNGWKPVGQGDPLKNDPTFDYSPPALGRVRYWAENNKSKEESGKKNQSDILVLGSSSKRENMKKEQKHTSIRRSYYNAHLPTRLMPPPMQTIQPHKQMTSPMHLYQSTKNYFSSPSSSSYRTKSYYDLRKDEPIKIISITKDDPKYSMTYSGPNDFINIVSPRKPWIHELLEKEQINPKYHPHKLIATMPVKTIYEPHTTRSTPVYTPASTPHRIVPMNTTERPTFAPYRPLLGHEPIYSTVAPLESSSNLPNKQPDEHLEVSMYQIIEGHSKVKTYGKNVNGTSIHEPKIVPITPRHEAIVRRVTSHDDARITFEVKHLHNKERQTIAAGTTTTTTTTNKPIMTTNSKNYPVPSTQPQTQQGGMQGLLSLLDSSFGNIFMDEPAANQMGSLFSGTGLDNTPTVYVTTTTEYSPTGLDLGSPRSARQIFDYDQLPESRIKHSDFQDKCDDYSMTWLRSSGADVSSDITNE